MPISAMVKDAGWAASADLPSGTLLALDPATLSLRYALGRKGREPGDLMYPRGVASLPGNRLLVADTDNNRLQILDARLGTPIREIGDVDDVQDGLRLRGRVGSSRGGPTRRLCWRRCGPP